ncbi:CaiB/BaiF CoA transferase family protein [Litorimonas haliclonae]|uniref:CaiB/BaiF CoA transferase family protein n=1 Tax=Litorimonas haliclonae TaxID=2081977 RepID=UPI0039EEF854
MKKPLSGLRVVEFSHMVMGPAAGLMLADMGAEVIKVEPLGGDKTRRLRGAGAGYFPMYNRNKKSICIDLKSADGKAAILELIAKADVFIENFRPGALEKLGFGFDALKNLNPSLIYCSEKGFLDGPYSHRTALDEVTQMMGGLAYMTGPPGQPLRAGSSVIDVTGGMFGAMAVLGALYERATTGLGKHVSASLFETTVFLVGQHMAQKAVTGEAAAPMPARVSSWAIYQLFDTKDDEQVFIGVVSDGQWKILCEAFGLEHLLDDPELAENRDRVIHKDKFLPEIIEKFRSLTKAELMEKIENLGLPFAPIGKPEEMFDDPHLNAGGGLLDMEMEDGDRCKLPALPISLNGERLGLELDPPKAGEHTENVLASIGRSAEEIRKLKSAGVI